MGLFGGKKKKKKKGKKKGKKKDKKKAKDLAAPPPKAKAPAEEKPDEYNRTSIEDMGKVERQIDYFVERKTRGGVLDRYREKYGEDLDLPEELAGYRYEYEVEELSIESEVEVDLDKDIVVEEGDKGEVVEAAAATKEKKSFWGTKKEKKVKEPKVKAEEAAPKEKVVKEPLFDPNRFISRKSVAMCFLVGKPFFPVYGIFKYKISREPKPAWIKAFIVFPDIIPLALTWLWRVPARLGYMVYTWNKKAKERRAAMETAKEEEAATA
jgi:hypothetical protein